MSYRRELFEMSMRAKERKEKEHKNAVEKYLKYQCEVSANRGMMSAPVGIDDKLEDGTLITEEEIKEFAEKNNLDLIFYAENKLGRLGFDILPNLIDEQK